MSKTYGPITVNEYGDKRRVVTFEDDVAICYVSRHNGAWLIGWCGPDTDDATPDELYTCASSLRVAKRLAREGVIQEPSDLKRIRWEQRSAGSWVLTAIHTDSSEVGYEDDE